MKSLRLAWCSGLLFAAPAFSQIVTFDAPNATSTFTSGINARGEIVGGMTDSNGIGHGFLRSQSGEFIVFDAPVEGNSGAVAIDNAGVIIGNDVDTKGISHGFIRTPDGRITLVDYPGALTTTLVAINNLGVAVGYFIDAEGHQHGLIRNPDGSLIAFDDTPAGLIRPFSINDSGEIAGATFIISFLEETSHAFFRTPDGKVVDFNCSVGGATEATSISNSGEIDGTCQTSLLIVEGPDMAFERAPDGAITTFEAPIQNPASAVIDVFAMNERRTAVGGYFIPGPAKPVETSFVHFADGSFQTADFPADVSSVATGINRRGTVTGYYWDVGSPQVAHGYIWTPK